VAGADDYLVKPFGARELLVRISANLKLAKLHRQAEAALRASESQLRAYLTASFDVVYRMSPDWSVPRRLDGKEFMANTLDPSSGWLQKYIHPDCQPRVMEAINQAIRTKSIFALEYRALRVDGSLGWTFSRAIPMLDETGAIIEWLELPPT
jgi:PAS domain-containing protein